MSCDSCKNKNICKIYDLILSNMNICELKATKCKYYIIQNDYSCFPISQIKEKDIKTKTINKQNMLYYGQVKPDLKESIVSKKKVKEQLVKCPECNGQTYDTDLQPCIKCGKITCSNCGTEYKKSRICNNCWENGGI